MSRLRCPRGHTHIIPRLSQEIYCVTCGRSWDMSECKGGAERNRHLTKERCPFGHLLRIDDFKDYYHCQQCGEDWSTRVIIDTSDIVEAIVANGGGEPRQEPTCEGCNRKHRAFTKTDRWERDGQEYSTIECDKCGFEHEVPNRGKEQ